MSWPARSPSAPDNALQNAPHQPTGPSKPSLTKKIFQSIATFVADEAGYPASLRRALHTRREFFEPLATPHPTASAESIVYWHEWGARDGLLHGWRDFGNNYYGGLQIHRPELAQLVIQEEIHSWSCDIQDVVGLLSSKSRLERFASLDDLVKTNSPEMIADMSLEGLRKNLAHKEIRIIHQPNTYDYFARYDWDGRIFLMNSGGSHHFSAARYIAAALKQPVPLSGRMRTYRLNPDAVTSLHRDFAMHTLTRDAFSAFYRAMDQLRATFFMLEMPYPYFQHYAVLLPRNEPRANRAAHALSEAGVFDLGKHLRDLISNQSIRRSLPRSLVKARPYRIHNTLAPRAGI